MWFGELLCVSLPELCLVAKRRQGLANLSFAFTAECYKCNNGVLMALIILCVSTVSLGWLKSWEVFSAIPLSLVIGNLSAGFDELLISLSSTPSLHRLLGVLFLFCGGSCVTCGLLREAGDYFRDILTLPCRLNLPHGGHIEDKLGLDSLLYPVTNPLYNCLNHLPARIQRYSCTWDQTDGQCQQICNSGRIWWVDPLWYQYKWKTLQVC